MRARSGVNKHMLYNSFNTSKSLLFIKIVIFENQNGEEEGGQESAEQCHVLVEWPLARKALKDNANNFYVKSFLSS